MAWFRKGPRLRTREAVARCDPRKPLEDQSADAPSLKFVQNEKSDLGLPADARREVVPDSDHSAIRPWPAIASRHSRSEGSPGAGEFDHAARNVSDRTHEAHAGTLARDALHQGVDGRNVVRRRPSQQYALSVAQQSVLAEVTGLGNDLGTFGSSAGSEPVMARRFEQPLGHLPVSVRDLLAVRDVHATDRVVKGRRRLAAENVAPTAPPDLREVPAPEVVNQEIEECPDPRSRDERVAAASVNSTRPAVNSSAQPRMRRKIAS